MGTTIAILLLSLAIVGLSYGLLLQKWRMDALQHVLETHILMESQMAQMIREVVEGTQRKEHTNDSNG